MKAFIFGVGVVGLMVAITQLSQPVTYVNEVTDVATTTVEVVPDWASDEDAVVAAQAVIRKKELTAELEQLEVEKRALEERITEVEKELGTY